MCKLHKYIIPIYQQDYSASNGSIFSGQMIDSPIGNGFFADGFFFTAAHVIEEAEYPYIKIGKDRIFLNKDDSIIWRSISSEATNKYVNKNNGDVAVYYIEGIKSPFKLSNTPPVLNDKLESCYYYDNDWHYAIGTVGNDESWFSGNFFGWKTDFHSAHPTSGGSSGSPLYKNNTIYGILHGGNYEDPRICVFTNASFVKQLLPKEK